MAKQSKAHRIVPEIAHLIETEQTDTAVTDFGSHRSGTQHIQYKFKYKSRPNAAYKPSGQNMYILI